VSSAQISTHNLWPQRIGLALLLGAIGYLLNALSPLIIAFSVSFIFGSVATMMAALMVGPLAACAVGVAAGFYTWELWGHPWAMIIFGFEGLVCGLLVSQYASRFFRLSLTLASILFWLLVGAPLVWFFYAQFLGLGWESVRLIMLKQGLNGIINTVFAEIIVFSLVVPRLARFRLFGVQGLWRTRDINIALLVGVSLLTSILGVYFSGKNFLDEEQRIHSDRQEVLMNVLEDQFRYDLFPPDSTGSENTAFETDFISRFGKFSLRVVGPEERWTIGVIPEHIKFSGPSQEVVLSSSVAQPSMQRWQNSYRVSRRTLADLNIEFLIVQPMTSVVDRVWQHSSNSLSVAALIVGFVVFLGLVVTRFLTLPLMSIADVARQISAGTRGTTANDQLANYQGFEPSEIHDVRVAVTSALAAESTAFDALQRIASDQDKLIEEANAPIIVIDLQGKVLDWNRAAAKISGLPKEQALSRFIAECLPSPSPVLDIPSLVVTLASGEDLDTRRLSFENQDGKRMTVLISIVLLSDEKGDAERIVMVGQDLTDYLDKEQQLIQASKMSALGEMATGMAHELNQPLNIIRLCLQNVKRTIEKKPKRLHVIPKKLDEIDLQVSRAARLIDHLRLFGRRSGSEDENTLFNPHQAVIDAVGFFEKQLELADIDFQLSLVQCNCSVKGDVLLIEQVIMKILSNARDAVLEERINHPSSNFIALTASVEEDKFVIEVGDSGRGVSEEVLLHIFEPFYTTKAPGKGTGLGLSISDSSIRAMGGEITAKNKEFGLVFRIELPLVLEDDV